VSISLVQGERWDKPQVFIGHSGADGTPAVMLPLAEAPEMAALMAALGYEDIAALITQATDGAS
jgi:hypothetical protein